MYYGNKISKMIYTEASKIQDQTKLFENGIVKILTNNQICSTQLQNSTLNYSQLEKRTNGGTCINKIIVKSLSSPYFRKKRNCFFSGLMFNFFYHSTLLSVEKWFKKRRGAQKRPSLGSLFG